MNLYSEIGGEEVTDGVIACDVLFLGSSTVASLKQSLEGVEEPLQHILLRASSSSSSPSSSSHSVTGVETKLRMTASAIEIVNAAQTRARVDVSRVRYCCAISAKVGDSSSSSSSSSSYRLSYLESIVDLNETLNGSNLIIFILCLGNKNNNNGDENNNSNNNVELFAFVCRQPSSAFALVQACRHSYLHAGDKGESTYEKMRMTDANDGDTYVEINLDTDVDDEDALTSV